MTIHCNTETHIDSKQVGPGGALRHGDPAVRVFSVVLHQLDVRAPGGEGGQGGPGGEVGGDALDVAGNFPAVNVRSWLCYQHREIFT